MLRVLFFMLLSAASIAGDEENRPFSVAADLVGIPLGAYGLRVQYSIIPNIALTVPLNVTVKEGNLLPQTTTNILRVFGYGIFPDLRISSGLGIMFNYRGWYLEPMMNLGYAKINYPNFQQQMFLWAPSVMVGYQGVMDSGLLINLGIGISGLFYEPKIVGTNAWIPISTIAVGYAF